MYSVGETPVDALKRREKYCGDSNASSSDISLTLRRRSHSSRFASDIFISPKYSIMP